MGRKIDGLNLEVTSVDNLDYGTMHGMQNSHQQKVLEICFTW